MRKVLPAVFLIIGFTVAVQAVFSQAATEPFRCAAVPENPTPGEAVTVGASAGMGARSAVLLVEGRRLSKAAFFDVPAENGKQPFAAAVITVPATARPGAAEIIVEGPATGGVAIVLGQVSLVIARREFVSETIELTPALTAIRSEPDPQKTAESNHLWGILSRTGNSIYTIGNFIPPVTSTRRTSHFGNRRVFRYSDGRSDTSIHAGVDYGVPTGTRVTACGAGRVVLARPRIVTGNSIVIEHLPGVYSIYYHLDQIEVTEGSMVDAGALIGLSGATGLATGPHLHWEIRVSGENTDPDVFILRPLLDKDAVLSKMSN